MCTKYKVIKPFACANVNDFFTYDKETDMYNMSFEHSNEDTYYSKNMSISSKIILNYVSAGLIVPIEEEKVDTNPDKVKKLYTEIKRLQNKYNQRNKVVEEKYEAGKMPTCQKVEHDTVYFNLMKVLNKFESIINE